MSSSDICTTNEIRITNESQINEPKLKKSENNLIVLFLKEILSTAYRISWDGRIK